MVHVPTDQPEGDIEELLRSQDQRQIGGRTSNLVYQSDFGVVGTGSARLGYTCFRPGTELVRGHVDFKKIEPFGEQSSLAT